MKMALRITLAFLVMACAPTAFADAITQLNGKKIKLTARCGVSKVPDSVYVMIGKKKYRVDLTKEFQNKIDAGESAWIGLIGVCRDEQFGGPQTSESADGFIEVTKILFYDQQEGHKASVHVLK